MNQQITPLIHESYLVMIKNSVGSNQFRNFYVRSDNEQTDILQDGVLSCAFYVTSILHNFLLIDRPHATVNGTIKAIKEAEWREVPKPLEGCVLVWESQDFDDGPHRHIGFYTGNTRAISNNATLRTPQEHDWQFTDTNKRKITAIYWHEKLDE